MSHLLVLLVLLSKGCAAQEVRENGGTILLLGPPTTTTRELRGVLRSVGYDVPQRATVPQWTDDWLWKADPHNTGRTGGWAFAAEERDWRPMEVGRTWQSQGERHRGSAWYRRRFRWHPNAATEPCMVFRQMEDSVAVYVNGTRCGSGGGHWGDVQIPLSNLVDGVNLLSVRVVNSPTAGDPNRGGIAGLADLSVVLPDPSNLHSSYDTVLLTSDFLLSGQSGYALCEYVRVGGGLLVVFNDTGRALLDLPLERALPTFLGHPSSLPGTVGLEPVDASMTGLGVEGMAAVEVRAAVPLPYDPRFARPGTHDIKRWTLSPLAYDHVTLIRGNDPSSSPILTRCRFGTGTVAVCATPDALVSEAGRGAVTELLAQLRGTRYELDPPLAAASGVGMVPWEKLERMGFALVEEHDADILIIAASDENAKRELRDALKRDQHVVITDPRLLEDIPEADAWLPGSRPFSQQRAITDQAAWERIMQAAKPRVLNVELGDRVGTDQVSIACPPFGPVRGVWTDGAHGRQGTDGTWIVTPAASDRRLKVGVWGMDGQQMPSIHMGDKAVLVTGTGFRLDQPLPRPVAREPRGDVLWRWEDGRPAVAAVQVGSSLAVSPSVRLVTSDPRQIDWADMEGFKARYLHEDTSQLLALLARETAVGKHLLPGDFQTDSMGVTFTLSSDVSARQSFCLRYRWRDWQRSLLVARDRTLTFEPKGSVSVSIPWPDHRTRRRYHHTTSRDAYWLELAILSPHRDRCLAWVERHVRRSASHCAIWHSPVQLRNPPFETATWPRFHHEDFPDGWSPASQYPAFLADESVEIHVETWNRPPDQELVVSVTELLSGSSKELTFAGSRREPNPWSVRTWAFTPAERNGVYRIEAPGENAAASRSFIVCEETRGWRNVHWDKHKGVQVLGSLYPHMNALEFAAENLAADADRGLPWGPYRESWPGQPWCNFHPNPFSWLPNGVHYRTWLASTIQNLSRHVWTGERLTISASLVDGFNGVPWPEAMVHPQHLRWFVTWMEERFEYTIEENTIDDIATLVMNDLDPYWRLFVATELALPAHRIFRTELRTVSPQSQVTDQFDLPQLPTLLRIPEVESFAFEWQSLFDISSMDPWNVRAGRGYHCPTYLTCLGKALAPHGRVGHYHMEMLGGDGPERISKMDRIFRQNVDLLWMMAAQDTGEWVQVLDYPNGGGVSWVGGWETWLALCHRGRRGGHVAYPEDWGGLARLYAIGEALRPTRPRGFVFTACGPRLPPLGEPPVVTGDQARLFGVLRDSGLPIGGFARLDCLGDETPIDGLILPIAGGLSQGERDALRQVFSRGIPVGIIACGLDDQTISDFTGIPYSALSKGEVVVLREGNIRGPFWGDGVKESYPDFASFVEELRARTKLPVAVPPGIAWYAFESEQGLIVVLEELLGTSREAIVALTTSTTPRRMVELLSGESIMVNTTNSRSTITLPLSASGSAVIMIGD